MDSAIGPGENSRLRLQQQVAELETQLAECIRQHNEENGSLQGELVRLHSQVERGETERQKLEYSLALAQREGRQREEELGERETELQALQKSLQGRVSKLTRQCQEWKSTLETVQQARAQERAESQELVAAKDDRARLQCEELECVREQLEIDLSQERSTGDDLRAKVQHLEFELSEKEGAIQSQGHELEAASDRERKTQRDLQQSLQRVRALEESLEAERAARMDSKFTSEIAQLRARELEGILEAEKMAHGEAISALEEARQKVSHLQSTVDGEKKKQQLLQEQLHSKELETQSLEQQARDKQAVISDLSHQLQIHKANFEALKEELMQAKRQQGHMEETHSGWVRDLEALLRQFQSHTSKRQSPSKVPHTSQLVESLRVLLADLQSQLESTKSQLKISKQDASRLSTECATYREVVSSRTSAMAEAEQQLGESCREISRLKGELGRVELQVAGIKSEVEGLQHKLDQEKGRHREAREEVVGLQNEVEGLRQKLDQEKGRLREAREELLTLKKHHSSENEARCRFLQSICNQLQSTASPTPTFKLPQGQWSRLSAATNSAVEDITEALRKARNEITHLQSTVESSRATLQTTKAMHKEAMAKLTESLEEHQWESAERSSEVQQHYESLLSEAEDRNQKYKQYADEALQRADQLSASKQQLESQLNQLQDLHQTYKSDRACLLSSVCLLSGALFPALNRLHQLRQQKAFLSRELQDCQKLKEQVSELVTSILADMGPGKTHQDEEHSSFSSPLFSGSKLSPLLRFRKVVIAVIAARRFRTLHTENSYLFKVGREGEVPRVEVHIGQKSSRKASRTTGMVRPPPKFSDKDISGWLRSEKVLLGVRESLSELQSNLDACTQSQRTSRKEKTGTHYRRKPEMETTLLALTKTSFCVFLERMQAHFPHCYPFAKIELLELLTSSSPLCRGLGEGLTRVLRNTAAPVTRYATCDELGETLHTQLVSLVGRLHDGELDRCSLRSQLLQSQAESERLSGACREALERGQKAESLQRQLEQMVPGERFEAVYRDLQQSLGREKETQAALTQQASSIHQLQSKLQLLVQELQSKDSALTGTVKELSDIHLMLRQKDHQLHQVDRQLQQTEREKELTVHQLRDIQAALQQAVSEKETIQQLLQCANEAFQQSKQRLSETGKGDQGVDFSQVILKATEEFALQRPNIGPEADNCQCMLKSFVDAHQCALSCLATLHGHVTSCEGHIQALKVELSAACRRQIAGIALSASVTKQAKQSEERMTQEEEFVPLREHPNASGSLDPEQFHSTPHKMSPIDESLVIASQGAKLGVELAKALNL